MAELKLGYELLKKMEINNNKFICLIMRDKKYLENQASILINNYNSKRFAEVVQKGKVLIKKFPNKLIFYNATALSLSALGKNYEALGILKLALDLSPKKSFCLSNYF